MINQVTGIRSFYTFLHLLDEPLFTLHELLNGLRHQPGPGPVHGFCHLAYPFQRFFI